MDILVQIVTMLILSIMCEMIIAKLLPSFKQKEQEYNQSASINKTVGLNRQIFLIFLVMAIFVFVVGVLILAIPAISKLLNINYIALIIVWWIPLIFDIFMFILMSVKIKYNEEDFVYTNAFGIKKNIKYNQITNIEIKANKIIVFTQQGKIRLLNAFSGVQEFLNFVKQKIFLVS